MAPASSAAVGLATPCPAMSFATCRAPYSHSTTFTTTHAIFIMPREGMSTSNTKSSARSFEGLQGLVSDAPRPHCVSGHVPCPPATALRGIQGMA